MAIAGEWNGIADRTGQDRSQHVCCVMEGLELSHTGNRQSRCGFRGQHSTKRQNTTGNGDGAGAHLTTVVYSFRDSRVFLLILN